MRGPTIEKKWGQTSKTGLKEPAMTKHWSQRRTPKEALTVDVNIAADIGAAKRIGNLTGNWFGKEGVVHYDLIRVSGDLLDYASSLGPSDTKTIE